MEKRLMKKFLYMFLLAAAVASAFSFTLAARYSREKSSCCTEKSASGPITKTTSRISAATSMTPS
jgi:hypothetical protein